MYERALVPLLDGSIVAEGVIPFILQTAGPLGLEVTLLRVVVPAPPAVVEAGPIVVDDTDKVCAEAEVYLAALATELRAGPGDWKAARSRHRRKAHRLVVNPR